MTNEKRPWYLLWIDLEATGSKTDDPILEVGCILTEQTYPFSEIANYEAVVRPEQPDWTTRMNPVVLEMHVRNGLLADVFERGRPLGDVEQDLVQLLADRHIRPHEVVLAGSGVGHYDKRLIDAQMPKLSKWLRYHVIDVGVVRRFFYAVGGPERTGGDLPAEKRHRGLDDIADHLAEARFYAVALAGGEEARAASRGGDAALRFTGADAIRASERSTASGRP